MQSPSCRPRCPTAHRCFPLIRRIPGPTFSPSAFRPTATTRAPSFANNSAHARTRAGYHRHFAVQFHNDASFQPISWYLPCFFTESYAFCVNDLVFEKAPFNQIKIKTVPCKGIVTPWNLLYNKTVITRLRWNMHRQTRHETIPVRSGICGYVIYSGSLLQ